MPLKAERALRRDELTLELEAHHRAIREHQAAIEALWPETAALIQADLEEAAGTMPPTSLRYSDKPVRFEVIECEKPKLSNDTAVTREDIIRDAAYSEMLRRRRSEIIADA